MSKIIENAGGEWSDKNIDILEIYSPTHAKSFGKYSLANPHPGYGADPNILNELGYTEYPKWVDSKIENKRVVVNNPTEEASHTGEPAKVQKPASTDTWS